MYIYTLCIVNIHCVKSLDALHVHVLQSMRHFLEVPGKHGGLVVECRTPNYEVLGLKPFTAHNSGQSSTEEILTLSEHD